MLGLLMGRGFGQGGPRRRGAWAARGALGGAGALWGQPALMTGSPPALAWSRLQTFFVESVCVDPEVIAANIVVRA